jgi:phage gpG-like protein
MAGSGIRINDQELRRLLGALSDLRDSARDMTPAMHDIGQALTEGIREHIRDGKDWDGSAFAPNSTLVIARKGRNQPLVDRGNLVGQRLHYQARSDSVEIGSSAVQAATLHFGASRGAFGRTRHGAPIPWGNIPPRPFMPVDGQGGLARGARQTVIETITDHLRDAVGS